MDVLVTGGAGFIGSHVCRSLRRNGLAGRIVVLDDFSTGLESNLSGIEDVEFAEGSVLDETLVTSWWARSEQLCTLLRSRRWRGPCRIPEAVTMPTPRARSWFWKRRAATRAT